MSADGYAAMSAKRVLQLFVEAAKSTPTIYAEWRTALASGVSEKVKPTPERDARGLGPAGARAHANGLNIVSAPMRWPCDMSSE